MLALDRSRLEYLESCLKKDSIPTILPDGSWCNIRDTKKLREYRIEAEKLRDRLTAIGALQ